MLSSEKPRAVALAALLVATSLVASRAEAQQQAQGFALERLYSSAPGGGWFVMDALDMRGGLGGGVAISGGYAHDPLRVTNGAQHLNVVADQASFDVALAATYDRFRLYLNLEGPIVSKGTGGSVGDYDFTAPSFDISTRPDNFSDARFGFDARLLGDPKGPFRLGGGAQLYVPFGALRADYLSDATYRAMGRLLVAGDVGSFTYAGQLGVHVRPLDDSPIPGSPRGSELLFGLAAGPRFPVGSRGTVVVVGPEFYGETAFNSFLSTMATGIEGLLSGRVEGTSDDGTQLRVKLGAGAGINPQFGAPEWRFVFGIELFDHGTDRDGDGVTDSKDACPDTPGVKTKDPKTNGCPVSPAADAAPTG